jgi:hypothetical protein
MAPRTVVGACWLSLLLLCSPALATASEATDLPARWQVRADGWSGTLELSIESSGRVSGTLQDRPVTGFLAGRRLVLHRTLDGRTEVWDGWLPEDLSASELFVAGSVTVGDRIRPWYAVPDAGVDTGSIATASPAAVVPSDPAPRVVTAPRVDVPPRSAEPAAAAPKEKTAPAEHAAPEPVEAPAVAAATAEEEPPPPAGAPADDPALQRPPASEWRGWDLTGVWITTEGRAKIEQDGRGLSVILADGTRHEGRFTATDTVVVGLRKGCCKGKIKDPYSITWSDGATWRRDR